MKKIYAILAVFLCVGMIAPVCAFPIEKTHMDSWGRTCLFDNGDAIYFGQTVGVTEASICYNFDFEIIENCTVTVTTNNHVVVVDENGDRVISKNGVEFHYSPNRRVTSMAWNNFPLTGGKVEVKKDYQPITDVMYYLYNTYVKPGKSITFRDLPTEITYENMTFTQVYYAEPTNNSPADKIKHFCAYYEDLGGYYRLEIESSNPWTSTAVPGFAGYINGNTTAYPRSSYLEFLADDTVDESTITSIVARGKPRAGEFKMDENWTEKFTIGYGDAFTSYHIKRLAPAPVSFSNFEVMDFETSGEAAMEMLVRCTKGAHSTDEFMIVQKGTWTSKDVKAHAEEKGVEYVYVLQFP